MAPPASAMLAVGAAVTQAPPVPPATGMFPNIMSLPTGQVCAFLELILQCPAGIWRTPYDANPGYDTAG